MKRAQLDREAGIALTIRCVFANKPIIGIAGGIGSGKSFVAKLFGELGCLVISSDDLVRQAYLDPAVKTAIKQWFGNLIFLPTGEVDRHAVAERVFKNSPERQRLEKLLHPIVDEARQKTMSEAAADPKVLAFVWDTPLLFETSLNLRCDETVFVDAPQTLRLKRLQEHRRWDAQDLAERENLQWPLDKKRDISDHVISNAADAGHARSQVEDVFSQILAKQKLRF